MNTRLCAVDIGNDSLKGLFGPQKKEVYIPNIISEIGPSRQIVELEKTALDGLHVEITSGALKRGKGTFAVGKLASRQLQNDELTPEAEKSNNDQSVIMLLTAIAYDSVKSFPEEDGVIEATYFLSTGLPLDESKKGKRKEFKNKLKSSYHEIRFLHTPDMSGKVVHIKFSDVLVNTEGHAAMIDLTTNSDGSLRNEELTKMTLLIQDIGGLSTDAAIITSDGNVDNTNSDGIKEGISPYLDEIMDAVERNYGYKFKSRRELVDVITDERAEERNHIYIKGNRQSIKDIVDESLQRLAKEEYKLTKKLWLRVPSLRLAYLIGGGSLVLRSYIQNLNDQEEKYPLRFVNPKESIWMIVNAYFKLLQIYIQHKGIEVAATKE